MADEIKRIVDFNKNAGLLSKGYDDFLESSFQIEEALEGLEDKTTGRVTTTVASGTPKDLARMIVAENLANATTPVPDVDRLDKACDAIVFAVGSMAKLGLSSEQISKALNIVMDANEAKLGCKKDEYGKLTKPTNFPNPEPRLLELLNKI